MYCKHCGKEIADDSKFCQYCGKSLESNTINYFESIKSFISSNKKIVKIFIGILICIAIGWIWYINTPSYIEIGILKEPNNYQYEKDIITFGYMYFSRLQQCK